MDASQTQNIRKFYDAALKGDINSFQNLLHEDPHILDRCIIEKSSAYTQSPLHVASAKGHLPIIETLLKENPRMCYAYDQDGNTPIHVAVVNGHREVLNLFLQKQPLAVREPTTRGETVLHLCVKFNQPDVLRSLLKFTDENGNLQDSRDSNGNTYLHPAVADQYTQSPLHVAANMGHLEMVEILLNAKLNLCLAHDQDGRTPLHVAAAKGQVHVLEVLHRANHYAAQERANNGESILHLCVKHNHLEALKTLIGLTNEDGDQIINSKDNNGNTILHLAVTNKQPEIVEYLLKECKSSIKIDALNNKGMTVADVYKKQSKRAPGDSTIERSLKQVKAKGAKETLDYQAERLENQRSALMVVASLIATMAFQAGVNPPGGVYQDTKEGNHEAGFAIWPYYYKDNYYNIALISNTIGFVSSISVITLLISGLPFKREYLISILRVTLWIAAVATSITYAVVLNYVTRTDDPPLSDAILMSYVVWVYVMVFILIANVAGFIWRRKDFILSCFKNCFAPEATDHSNNYP